MTPRDFCYWLQGYFELAGAIVVANRNVLWTDDIRTIVLKHIALVKATPGNYSSELQHFIGWLESAIEFNAPVGLIKEKLNSIFEHVIDPATPGNAVEQNQIHHSEGWGARC